MYITNMLRRCLEQDSVNNASAAERRKGKKKAVRPTPRWRGLIGGLLISARRGHVFVLSRPPPALANEIMRTHTHTEKQKIEMMKRRDGNVNVQVKRQLCLPTVGVVSAVVVPDDQVGRPALAEPLGGVGGVAVAVA